MTALYAVIYLLAVVCFAGAAAINRTNPVAAFRLLAVGAALFALPSCITQFRALS